MVFVGFYGIVFELVAGAQPTLYVQIYVLEDTERQRIWQRRTLRFSDDSPTRRTASTKSLSIARAGHQVGDVLVYELGTNLLVHKFQGHGQGQVGHLVSICRRAIHTDCIVEKSLCNPNYLLANDR